LFVEPSLDTDIAGAVCPWRLEGGAGGQGPTGPYQLLNRASSGIGPVSIIDVLEEGEGDEDLCLLINELTGLI
jgi:hypothetical protein